MLNNMIERLLRTWMRFKSKKLKEKSLKRVRNWPSNSKLFIPHTFPSIPHIDIQTALIPAKEVGGIFNDCFINPSSPDELVLLIADSAGHGVYGCFYSVTMRSILRRSVPHKTNLAQILKQANQLFYKDSQETQVFVTVWMGIYNMKTGELTYSSCGHPLGFV